MNPTNKITEQDVLNRSFDSTTNALAVIGLGYDGVLAQRQPSPFVSLKVTESGSVTYVGIASPGTAQSTAKWQCKKIDESTAGTTLITWADGDANYDNTATDLTALTYS